MRSFEDTVFVAAPARMVSAYLNTPENWAIVMPSAVEVGDGEELANGGHRFSFVYTLAGIRSHATAEVTEYDPGKRLVVHVENGMTGEYRFDFTERSGGSRVGLSVDYELTGAFENKLVGAVSTENIERQFRTLLATLKNRAEMQADAATAR